MLNPDGQILMVEEYGQYWGMPRGHVEAGEDNKQAAIREIREETGLVDLTYVKDLGSYERYTFDADGTENFRELKNIIFLLFKTSETKLKPQDKNITDAKWMDLKDVPELLINKADRQFFKSVLHLL